MSTPRGRECDEFNLCARCGGTKMMRRVFEFENINLKNKFLLYYNDTNRHLFDRPCPIYRAATAIRCYFSIVNCSCFGFVAVFV